MYSTHTATTRLYTMKEIIKRQIDENIANGFSIKYYFLTYYPDDFWEDLEKVVAESFPEHLETLHKIMILK